MIVGGSGNIIDLITSTDADIDVQASWTDKSSTNFNSGPTNTQITSATTTTIVPTPASGNIRSLVSLKIFNIHATGMNTLTVRHFDGAISARCWKGTLQAGESVEYDGKVFSVFNSAGYPVITSYSGPKDVQIFSATGNFTWDKPTYFTPSFVKVICYGGGGGGGGGASTSGAVARMGGCGGGAGARVEALYLADSLGSSEPGYVGIGGNGGAGGGPGISGSPGANGQSSYFSTGMNLITAYGGGGGCGGTATAAAGAGGGGGGLLAGGGLGTAAAAAGGGPGTPATPSAGCGANSLATADQPVCAEYGGGAGGGHTNVPANGIGGGSLFGGTGGGHGAGATNVPGLINATAGGPHAITGNGAGVAGTSGGTPTVGTAGTDGNSNAGGLGGGGGGGTITPNINGSAGGNGGGCGGGGGGGGIGHTTGSGGNGGNGGNGRVYVITY